VQSEAEIRIWVADGTANGLRPWFTKFGGVLHDPRWLRVVEEIYRRHAGWERYLRNVSPLARVGLVYSQQTAWFYGGERAGAKIEDPTLGWYQALIEARIPFEMVHDRLLGPPHLNPFKTLILPNIAALSDGQCEQLRSFVKNGGSLIATYETSLYDEWGVKRTDFGLTDLLGVSFKARVDGPMHNAYLRLEHNSVHAHPLLKDLEDAPRIIHGVWRLEVEARIGFPKPPITLIPSYPDLPMEKVYPRTPKTDKPEVYLHELPGAPDQGIRGSDSGLGSRASDFKRTAARLVYFPWDIDRTFWEVQCVDHFKLLRNAVEWATNEEPPVTVTGPGVLDVTVWRQKDSMTMHLVNLTNPMMMKGPMRQLIPVGPQNVRLRIPAGMRARKIRLLAANSTPPVKRDGRFLSLTVPSILDHEIVAVDLQS
jgi:hypothetical protein